MKRQHSSSDAEDSGRPAKASRTRDDQKLDLNATPRGFDLNAPFSEEEGNEWPEESVPSSPRNFQHDSAQTSIFNCKLEAAAELGIDGDLDLLHSIWNACSQEDSQRVDEILAGLCEDIGKAPSSPPRYQYLTCFYVSKKLSAAFTLPKTYKILLSFLESNGPGSSTKKQNVLPVFSCRLLFRAFSENTEWPLEFVKVYLEDAISARNWVDNDGCKEFVSNVMTAFRDDDQDIGMGTDDIQGHPYDTTVKADSAPSNQQATIGVKNRYPRDETRQKAKMELLQALNQLLSVPTVKENPRSLFRLLMLGVCYEEVRVSASNMLEIWLNNPVHYRGAKVLLDRIIHYTHGTTASDYETVANILGMRISNQGITQMKTSSSTNNIYADVVFQLVQKRPEYSSLALKTFLTAELNSKVFQNVKGIAAVLKALPDSSSPERELALVIKELALNEVYESRLQETVGRLAKQLSREISPFHLSRALLEPWPSIQEQQESTRQFWFKQVISLACHLMIQAVVPFASDDKFVLAISTEDEQETCKDILPHFEDLSSKVLTFQIEALTWCADVLNSYIPRRDPNEFSASVRMLMFLKPIEEYHLSDTELSCFQLVAFCMHASEEILARVILMGISNQFPMLQEDALHIIECLVWRAAASKKNIFGTLFADNVQLPAAIMKLSSFNLANLARQPLPQVVLKDMYWRSCLLIVAIAAYNPSAIGKSVWENVPAIKYLMECLITETTSLSKTNTEEHDAANSDMKAEEAVEAFLEKEFESNAEAVSASVDRKWKGNVMLLNNSTNQRMPPEHVLEELVELDRIYHLGRTLRSCKNPNFVGDMVSSQDFKQGWAWIKTIVTKEPELVGILPYSWQCKLLYIYHLNGQNESTLIQEIRTNLNKLIAENISEAETTAIIKFLSGKLISENSSVRCCGSRCLSGILEKVTPSGCSVSWLEAIESSKSARNILNVVFPAVQEALLRECSMPVIWSYLTFLKRHLPVSSFAYNSARLLVHRNMLALALMSATSKEIISGSSDQDTLPFTDMILEAFSEICTQSVTNWDGLNSLLVKLVSAQDMKGSTIPRIIPEAMVELLCFVGSCGNEVYRKKASYGRILQFLFPGVTDTSQSKPGKDKFVAYIELDSGQKLSILSKEQAACLVRTKDSRLIKAGLSKIDFVDKVKVLADSGLSAEAKENILKELEALSDSSLQALLMSMPRWQRLSLCDFCPRAKEFASVQSESQNSDNISAGQQDLVSTQLGQTRCYGEAIVKSNLTRLLCATKEDCTIPSSDFVQDFVSFRILLQKAAVEVCDKILDWVHEVLGEIRFSKGKVLCPSLVFLILLLVHRAVSQSSVDVLKAKAVLTTLKSGFDQERESGLVFPCSKRICQLEETLAEKLKDETTDLQADTTEKLISLVPARLEQAIAESLKQKLENYLEAGESSDGPFLPLIQAVVSSFKDLERQESEGSFGVEMAGRYALLAEFLSYFDPIITSKDWTMPSSSFNSLMENKKDLVRLSMFLEYTAQKTTQESRAALKDKIWNKVSRDLNSMENKQLDNISPYFVAPVILELLSASWGSYFVSKKKDFCASFMISEGLSSTRILASLAVLSRTVSELAGNRDAGVSNTLINASLDSHVLKAILQQLTCLAQKDSKNSCEEKVSNIQSAAAELICELYVVYPVTVGSIIGSSATSNIFSFSRVAFKLLKASDFYGMVHNAIRSVFKSRGNSAACGLCFYVATRHPCFMLLHISTLWLHLQEIIQGSGEQKSSLADLLVFTVELIDALRPCLLHTGSSSLMVNQVCNQLESLLALYLQVLEDLSSSDGMSRKFAIQLADFLSHCLAAGGSFSELVYSNRERIQLGFQKFGQARKVSTLMQSMGNPSASTSTLSSELDGTAIDKIQMMQRQVTQFLSMKDYDEGWDLAGLKDHMVRLESSRSILSILTDIDMASVHLPGILTTMKDSLAQLLKIEDAEISEKAYALLGRLLQYNSSETSKSAAYELLRQLSSSKAPQMEIAARHAVRLFHYCEELQESILMQLFRSGKAASGSLLEVISDTLVISGG